MQRLSGCWMLCIAALACHGQAGAPLTRDVAPLPSVRFPANWYPPDNDVTLTQAPQKGAPYTATLVTTVRYLNPATKTVQTISRSVLQARDGEGRRRDEVVTPRPDGHGGIVQAREVSVSDPVSHCSFQWMAPWAAPGKPTATVTCMPRTVKFINKNVYADSLVTEAREMRSPGMVDRFEPLGTKMFGDLEAVGTRHTRTATNPQGGKNQDLNLEIWYSPELKELLELRVVPGANESASQIPDLELKDIHRGEPSPALFYPADGYEIKPPGSN